MGRIKDLFIELQNKYGENMEDLPAKFSMEEYLLEKSKGEAAEATATELFCETVKRMKKNNAKKN
jgi:hypothetical protein